MNISLQFDVQTPDKLLPKDVMMGIIQMINTISEFKGTDFHIFIDDPTKTLPDWAPDVARRVVRELVIARLGRDDYMLDDRIAACEQHVLTIITECRIQSATRA